jgi:outer membrane protein, heavy metal efflux system
MRPTNATVVLAAAIAALAFSTAAARAESPLTVDQLVEIAVEVNPQVKGAHYRWDAAVHSIKQAYTPNDPIFSYINGDSQQDLFNRASFHTIQASESFQFPGKALLQTDQARRSAEIARFAYDATIRDIRAAVEAGYYQLLLDTALSAVNAENIANLERVLRVTQVAYAANRVTQTDFISAEFDLAAARNLQAQYRTAISNDESNLNQLLYRPPGAPLDVVKTLQLEALQVALQSLIDRAWTVRQEILEAALAEKNFDTALSLAKMEYLPDFTASYIFDHYLLNSAAPSPNRVEVSGWSVGFNVPVFFWIRQKEDIERARVSLEAARADLNSIRSQTAAAVTTLYRSAQYAYETSLLYRDSLTPLARQDFEVALIAYQAGKIDFVTLAGALRRNYGARISYLQAANQYLAGRVALEQAIGAPIPR